MSNSAVITKLQYKFTEADALTTIAFTSGSASLDQSCKKEAGGWVHTTKVAFKIAKNESSTQEPIATLLQRKAIYQVTDGNGTIYQLGTDEIKAQLAYAVVVGGKPGDFNGREVEITWISTTGAIIL